MCVDAKGAPYWESYYRLLQQNNPVHNTSNGDDTGIWNKPENPVTYSPNFKSCERVRERTKVLPHSSPGLPCNCKDCNWKKL